MEPGYHIKEIPKGELGESSKIMEELIELQDMEEQGCKILAAVELSDLIGAIEAYALKHYNMTLEDLIVASKITQRAFKNGYRN